MSDTGYRNRVQVMCDTLGIPNPIQEDDLTVSGLAFFPPGGDEWIDVYGTDMNRAGRLFFQMHVDRNGREPHTTLGGEEVEELKTLGEKHFRDMWHDAEEKDRQMLTNFKTADLIEIHWK